MRPVAVVALGRVACFACGKLFGNRDLSFAEKPRLEDVRGRHFDVTLDDGTPALIYPTGLPVSRRARDFGRISEEIERALTAHWDSLTLHVKLPTPE